MKNCLRVLAELLIISILTTCPAIAQTESYKAAIASFQVSYNGAQYAAIYNSFSGDMQKHLPLEKTKAFFAGLKAQAGDIKSMEFIRYEENTYAVYKTRFERATLAVNLSLDTQTRIDGLFVKPFKESSSQESKAIDALSSYPETVSKAIFKAAKGLPDKSQLSIAIIHQGKTDYYGIVKEHDSIKPANNQNQVFEIGSLTKVFTSTVLASLAVEDKLRLTDYVNKWFPFAFKDGAKISYESLANHTSGLPRLPSNLGASSPDNPYKDYGSAELNNYLKKHLKIQHTTTHPYLYSNLGAGLLGYSLGLSQKSTFRQLVQQRIFDKYGMQHTYTSSKGLGARLVAGMDATGAAVHNWDFDVLFSAGGILSTAEDLSGFAAAQFNPENLELALTRKPTFMVDDGMSIGLGWHILKSGSGNDFVWHNGGTAGYSSSMAVDVEGKTSVIILSNVGDASESIDALCFELLRDMAGK